VGKLLNGPFEALTEKTITDLAVFQQELASIREQGYALDNEEITRGIMCVAGPVFGFKREMVCAISLTFPAYLNEDRGIKPEIEAIKKYAELVSVSLGH
jgi:DNA-binding IclR family transcriptional regulator